MGSAFLGDVALVVLSDRTVTDVRSVAALVAGVAGVVDVAAVVGAVSDVVASVGLSDRRCVAGDTASVVGGYEPGSVSGSAGG